mmetsp:Transcript_35037/g.52352  ORF Transcript_35037/g.52352 Transcript_35037/m.52352 type:complete len:121 (+) Transcript_35037:265-627(+)
MQCKTRKLIYNMTRQSCREFKREFGLDYAACLGEESGCSESADIVAPSAVTPSTLSSVHAFPAPSSTLNVTPFPMELLLIVCSLLVGVLLGRSCACGRSRQTHGADARAVEDAIIGAPAE